MAALIVCGALALIFGILLLLAPRIIVKVGEVTNRIFMVDDFPIRHHVAMGIILIVLSISLFIVSRTING